MKKTKNGMAIAPVVLLTALSAFSQVQLFEQDLAGIHPYAGFKWNANILQPVLGFEYSIEGRTTLGFQFSKPLEDTLSIPGIESMTFNPFATFEFVEPGNLTVFSFAVRADLVYEDVTKPENNFNSFTRTGFGGGPIFALRLQTSDRISIIPAASYELFYVKWRWYSENRVNPTTLLPDVRGKGDEIWHNIIGGVNLAYHINEMQGVNFEPKVVVKVGDGLQSDDLINAEVNFGYFVTF